MSHRLRPDRPCSFTRAGDQVLWTSGLTVIQRREARGRPITALLRAQRWVGISRFFARFWAALLLIVSTLTGLVLVGFERFGWKDYVLGLIVPTGLFVLQEARQRQR